MYVGFGGMEGSGAGVKGVWWYWWDGGVGAGAAGCMMIFVGWRGLVLGCRVYGLGGMEGFGAGAAGCMVVLLYIVFFQLSGLRFIVFDLSFSTTGEW